MQLTLFDMSRVFLLLIGIYTVNSLSGIASFTYYESYAPCCPENENYDPDALTEECDKYSACDYTGDFEAIVSALIEDNFIFI